MRRIQLSIVIPAHNEEVTVAGVVRGHRETARALASSFELIVCDDGSTDGTWAELQRSCAEVAELRLLRNPSRQGIPPTMKRLYAEARGDWIYFTPGDGQVPAAALEPMWAIRDGAALAHLGYPDMRVPISFALTYPERGATPVPQLDLAAGLTLEFEAPDLETFPLLGLARRAGEQGGTYPCAYNAANEVAVAAFLEGRLPFLAIAETVEETLGEVGGAPARDLSELVEADTEARRLAERTAAAA